MPFKDKQKQRKYEIQYGKITYWPISVKVKRQSEEEAAVKFCEQVTNIPPSSYAHTALMEKLSAEGYLPSDSLLYKIRVGANEYAMSIIEFVVYALENLKREQELNPKLKDLTPAMAVEEMYILSHKDIYVSKQEKLPDWFAKRYPDFLSEKTE